MHFHRLSIVALASLLAFLFLASGTQRAYAISPIHVTTSGSAANNGSTWATATTLQHALATATPGDEIWVAKGVYIPGPAVSDTFTLTIGVALYGGFSGSENALSQRDFENNVTVLSGDIEDDDTKDADGVTIDASNIEGDNSRHVVLADGTSTPITGSTAIDGFTITAGYATNDSPVPYGGAIYCNGQGGTCSPHFANVTFAGNAADYGGAIYSDGRDSGVSSPSLVNIAFSGNKAFKIAGAMYNDGGNGVSSPTLENATVSGNSADTNAGAIYNDGKAGTSSPSFVNVTFADNSAPNGNGGAIYNKGYQEGVSSPILESVTFTHNVATYGGAIYNEGQNGTSSPTFVNVTFTVNSASFGGAIYNRGSDSGVTRPNLVNVLFQTNSAENGNGGAVYSEGNAGVSSPILVNVTFAGNSASFGGAMANVANNTGTSTPRLTNVILWGNTSASAGQQLFNTDATVAITTSLVQGGINGSGVFNSGAGTVTDGGGNLDADPLFIDAGASDLRLKFGSPAIDSGTNSAIAAATDLDGNPRKIDGNGDNNLIVDMGAYEAPSYKLLAIAFAGNGAGKVESAPDGSNCVDDCDLPFLVGTLVTLTATAGEGSTFAGWSGACQGTGTCSVTMDSSQSVTTTFTMTETETPSGSVQGTVVDDKGKGIAGATVTLTSTAEVVASALLTQSTDSQGKYRFEVVPAGQYSLTVSSNGKQPSAPQSVTVQAGQTQSVPTITLQPITQPSDKPQLHLPTLSKRE